MAAKKKASASGSDRGAKMKADAAQKKVQAKNAAKNVIPVQKYNYLGDKLVPKKQALSMQNDLAGWTGRTSQRAKDQAKRKKK